MSNEFDLKTALAGTLGVEADSPAEALLYVVRSMRAARQLHGLTLDEYQARAAETFVGDNRIERACLGPSDEAGEVSGVRKKYLRGDYDEDEYRRRMRKEVGDLQWQVAELCTAHGWSLEDIARENLAKLADRAERGVIRGDGDDR